MKNDLHERTFNFAKETLLLLKEFPRLPESDVIRYQLAKASTSIGANYEEAQGAYSSDDFAYKISTCLKEAKESDYWLRLTESVELLSDEKLKDLIQESTQLKNIFGSTMKRLNKKRRRDQ